MDGPNYFAAVADLAKDVGSVTAQVNERVTYKELMAQNTQQRGEISMRMDKVEENLSERVRQSVDALNLRLDALMDRMEAINQQQQQAHQNQSRGGGGKFAVGSIATTMGAAVGVAFYLFLRSMGVPVP